MTNSQNTPVHSLDSVQERLKQLHTGLGMPWRQIGALDEFQHKPTGKRIPFGTLNAIAHGREPKIAWHRETLGLPALTYAPICAHCGKPMVRNTCQKASCKEKTDLYDMPVSAVREMLEQTLQRLDEMIIKGHS